MFTPSNMGRMAKVPVNLEWQTWQLGSFAGSKRPTSSRLRDGMSTVHATAVQPASSARFNMPWVVGQSEVE